MIRLCSNKVQTLGLLINILEEHNIACYERDFVVRKQAYEVFHPRNLR